MNKIDLAYIAGFIDGEGCIGILKRNRKHYSPEYHVYVSVGQKDAAIIDWLKTNFGGTVHKIKRDGSFSWSVGYKLAYILLEQITPYLRYKQPQAKLALKFYKEVVPSSRGKGMGGKLTPDELARREELLLQLKALKKVFTNSYYSAGTTTKRNDPQGM